MKDATKQTENEALAFVPVKKVMTRPAIAKTSNLKTLAELYGVCSKTMKKKIDAIKDKLGDRTGKRLYDIREVEIIFLSFGTPTIELSY